MKKQFEIGMDHPAMAGAKAGMGACLKAAIKKAIETGSNEGSATLKVNFEIFKTTDKDTGEIKTTPIIKCKFGYSVPMKQNGELTLTESCRIIQNKDGEFMLVQEQIGMDELLEDDEE